MGVTSIMKNLFTKHLGLKLFCLILAVGLWVFVSVNDNKTEFFPGEIPIMTKNLPAQWAAVYDQYNAKIKISASNSSWSKLSQDDFDVYLDMKKYGIGTYEIEPKVNIALAGIQIVDIQPAKIRVRIEQATQSKMSVAVKFQGSVASGYEINSVKIDPTTVEAWGAKDVLQDLVQATALVKLNGDDRDFDKAIRLIALDDNDREIPLVRFEPDKVSLSVSLSRKGGGKTVGVKPNIVGNPASGFWLSEIKYDPKYVKIKGSEEVIGKTEFLSTEDINIDNIDSNRKFDVKLNLPKGISLVDDIKNISIEITISQITQSKEVSAGIGFSNLDSNLKITEINPNVLTVVVSGSSWAIGAANSENTIANIDLKGKSAGTYDMEINKESFSYPQNIGLVSFVPNIIRVKIENQ